MAREIQNEDIAIENAELRFKNFSGKEGKFNALFNGDIDWSEKVLTSFKKSYLSGADGDDKKHFVEEWDETVKRWQGEYN